MRLLLIALCTLVLAGCSALYKSGTERTGPFSYTITTQGCACDVFTTRDDEGKPVHYEFRAVFEVDSMVATKVFVTIVNDANKPLVFTDANARISSKNFQYRFNGLAVPIITDAIKPTERRTLTFEGQAKPTSGDCWLAIAGEELTLEIKGIQLGLTTLSKKTVVFVPRNPKLGV